MTVHRRCLTVLATAIACLLAPAATLAGAGVHFASHDDPWTAGLAEHPLARSAGAEWCGQLRSRDDKANELDNGPFRFHAVYLVPSDAIDRFPQVASQIQSDAFDASALLQQLYGRALRYDMGTSCGQGYLDITDVRARASSADFAHAAQTADGTAALVRSSLRAAALPVMRSGDTRRRARTYRADYVVWVDGPAPADSCGSATVIQDATRSRSNWNNYGGKVGTIFHPDGQTFCGSDTVRHEVGHMLGAVTLRAPNSADGGHCDDAYEDTMCYPSAPSEGDGGFESQFFDYGNNDYWDPPGGPGLAWWTVNLSRFVCHDVVCNER